MSKRLVQRLAVIAVVMLSVAVLWQVGLAAGWIQPDAPECEPGRIEERDATGKVVKVTRKTCFND